MAKPAGLTPAISQDSGPLSQLAQQHDTPDTPGTLPASITGAWKQYTDALGVAVPHNVNRARAAAGRFMQTVR